MLGLGAIISAAFQFLSGPAVSGIATALSENAKAKANVAIRLAEAQGKTNQAAVEAECKVLLAAYEADEAMLRAQYALMMAEMAFPIMRWVRPGFAYLCMFHFGAVVLASCGLIRGPIAALPSPMDWLELGIICSYFLLRPREKEKRVSLVQQASTK